MSSKCQILQVLFSGTHNEERELREIDTHKEHIEGKMDKGKQQITHVTSLCKWMADQ